jgi:hypothetical protein
MITIYSIKGTTYQPYNIPTQDIEDVLERLFVVNFIRWLALEVLGLFKRPVRLLSFLLLFWPVILYG